MATAVFPLTASQATQEAPQPSSRRRRIFASKITASAVIPVVVRSALGEGFVLGARADAFLVRPRSSSLDLPGLRRSMYAPRRTSVLSAGGSERPGAQRPA